MIKVVGLTPEGRQVVRGVYDFYETHGMPLDALLETLRNRGMVPASTASYMKPLRQE